MGTRYNHLSRDERVAIGIMLRDGKSLSEISRALGRNKGTISREIKRNSSPKQSYYTMPWAHLKAERRSWRAHRRPRLKNGQIVLYVRSKLKEGWSPEQIAGRIGLDHPGFSISHEAVYQYIYSLGRARSKELTVHLRCRHPRRWKKRMGRRCRKPKIKNRISIEQRPATVETRRQFGHWEGDTIVSMKSRGTLSCLVERKSRLLLLTKLPKRSSDDVTRAIVRRLGSFPLHARRSLTLDNGSENAGHEKITASLKVQCYFAHPYASWERGTNENTNGLVRWYLPKGTDLSKIPAEQIALIESLINNRPRKCLGYKTPIEVASSCVALRR
jgi:transposase, IS30 family